MLPFLCHYPEDLNQITLAFESYLGCLSNTFIELGELLSMSVLSSQPLIEPSRPFLELLSHCFGAEQSLLQNSKSCHCTHDCMHTIHILQAYTFQFSNPGHIQFHLNLNIFHQKRGKLGYRFGSE